MELVKIQLKDLENFCNSEVFQHFTVKPISPLRVKSYIHNPRADQNDYVLYMLVANGEMVAFRTIVGDYVFTTDQPIKFGWCSGSWVTPHLRRTGLSKQLLHECFQDWQQRLMFTNYAENSKQLYLDSNFFCILQQRTGRRFYLFPNCYEILLKKSTPSWLKQLSPIFSAVFTLYTHVKLFFRKTNNLYFTELDTLDEDCQQLFSFSLSNTLYRRQTDEWLWILHYPWMQQDVVDNYEYPFSYGGKNFQTKIIKYTAGGQSLGFFIYSIVNRNMKVLYYYDNNTKVNMQNLAKIVVDVAIKNKISYLTILDTELVSAIQRHSFWFVFSKTISSNVYSSFQLENVNSQKIFDGDGDNCFT